MALAWKLVVLTVGIIFASFVEGQYAEAHASATVVATSDSYWPGEVTTPHYEYEYKGYEKRCDVDIHFGDVEENLRSSIWLADVKKAAYTLNSNRTFSLAAGFTYDPKEACAVVRTKERENDPDVVAFRAAALNVYNYGNPARIAKIMVESFVSDCLTCRVFRDANELDKITDDFTAYLSDKNNLHEVLFGDPRKDEGRRKLLATEVSPTNSFQCAFCFPKKACRSCSWC